MGPLAEAARRLAEEGKTPLYAAIDGSDFYSNPVAPQARSQMNVPFLLASDELNKPFLAEAEEAAD